MSSDDEAIHDRWPGRKLRGRGLPAEDVDSDSPAGCPYKEQQIEGVEQDENERSDAEPEEVDDKLDHGEAAELSLEPASSRLRGSCRRGFRQSEAFQEENLNMLRNELVKGQNASKLILDALGKLNEVSAFA